MKKMRKMFAAVVSTVLAVSMSSAMVSAEETEVGHNWGNDIIIINPTCTTNGMMIKKCQDCGEVEQFTLPAKGHEFDNPTVIKKATCLEDGLEEGTCSLCGTTEKIVTSKHGHVMNIVYENGQYTYTCRMCKIQESEYSEDGFNAHLTADKVSAKPGETVTLNLYADTHGAKYSAFEMMANYDETSLKIQDMSLSDDLYEKGSFVNPEAGAAVYCYIGNDDKFHINDPLKPLVTYQFQVSEDAKPGSYDIVLSGTNENKDVLFCTVNKANVISNRLGEVVLKDAITVTCSHEYEEQVIQPKGGEKGYTIHECKLCGDSYTDNYTEMELGDLNRDSQMTISDVVLMQKYLSNYYKLDSEQILPADMNGDGDVNVFDNILMKRTLLKMPEA